MPSNALDALDDDQARLSENVLKLRYGLVANYDGINRIVAETFAAKAALAGGDGAIASRGNARVDQLFGAYSAALDEHREARRTLQVRQRAAEEFPALPAARRRGPAPSAAARPGRPAGSPNNIADLYFATLRYGTGADDGLAPAIAGEASRKLRADALHLPPRCAATSSMSRRTPKSSCASGRNGQQADAAASSSPRRLRWRAN